MQQQGQAHDTFESTNDAIVLRELLNTEVMFIGGGEAAVNSY